MPLENEKIEVAEEKETEMPNVEELLKILLDVNLEQNRQTVHLLMNYMNDIEENFFSVLEELDTVKAQLAQVQQTPQTKEVRHTLADLMQNLQEQANHLQEQANHLQEQIHSMKTRLNEKAAQLVQNFKDQGVTALNHVCEFLGVKENLTQMRESLLQSAKEMQGSMDKIDQVAGELRAATTHVKNVGRAIVGKEAQEVAQPKEGGFFYQMKRPYRAMQDFCLKNAGKIEKDIHKIENLEQRVEKIADGKKAAGVEKLPDKQEKSSIMEKLQSMKEKQAGQQKTAPMVETAKKQEAAL